VSTLFGAPGIPASETQRSGADDAPAGAVPTRATGALSTPARLAERMPGPPLESIPLFPASWYLFGDSSSLRERPVSREMLGRLLVAFRDSSGKAHVVDGRCPHMGADLSRGKVVGDTLQCPFHGWRFGADGACMAAPGCGGGVPGARVRTCETVERLGSIYFFNGPKAATPLPFFENENPDDFLAARVFHIDYPAPWFQVMGNAFDVQHFLVVHDRKLIGDSIHEKPHPFSQRWMYSVEVTGQSLADRFLRAALGKVVNVSQQVWYGNILMTHAAFQRADNRVIFVLEPINEHACRMNIQVLVRRDRLGLLSGVFDRLSLAGRRFLTHEFLKHEVSRLGSLRYYSGGLVVADEPFVDFLNWTNSLPRV
jgi:nitrite reductase/ring-hydroxylating ferredoxin subunit